MSTRTKPRFKRQESWRLKRVKENWRRPRGVTSRMRKEKKGWPVKVKIGYGTRTSTRGLHPRGLVERLVENESDLEGLDAKVHIVRLSAHLGERRRLVLLDRVKSLNVHVANPGKEEARTVGEEKVPAEPVAEPEAPETGASTRAEPQAESLEAQITGEEEGTSEASGSKEDER